MSKTRRRRRRSNRKKKNDAAAAASSKDTIKNSDNSGVNVPWSDLNHDTLLLVMMRLGIVDFFAFSGVCKSWRSLAVSNKNKFIVSRPPMSIHLSGGSKNEECHFEDFEGRKFKPIIPHYAGRMCIGVTCGYLILLSEKDNDLRLVNLITRHELHFPDVPGDIFYCMGDVRAILVFSPSISEWVLVVLNFCTHNIWFSVVGKREWIKVSNTPYSTVDLYAFKGKIYTLHSFSDEVWIREVRLYPEPELVSLEPESISKPDLTFPEFNIFWATGENLYVIAQVSEHSYTNIQEHAYTTIYQLDFGNMKFVSLEKKGKEYAFFFSKLWHHSQAVILPESWVDLSSQYRRDFVTDKRCRKHKIFHARIWYFFHDCFNVDHIHE